MPKTRSRDEFITTRAAAAIIGRGEQVRRLALMGLIRRQSIPGCRDRYSRADLERLAVESIKGGELATAS